VTQSIEFAKELGQQEKLRKQKDIGWLSRIKGERGGRIEGNKRGRVAKGTERTLDWFS